MKSRLLRRLSAGVLAAALLGLTACAGDSDGDDTPDPGVESEIDPDAILRFTAAGPSRNLDPVLQTSYGGWGYLVLIWDRLTTLDKDDNVQPGLATEWAFAEDGSYLEMKLRDDVSFHDGTKFNAEAVKVNIERGKTLEDSAVKNDLADIESVEVVDEYTVRFHLVAGRGVQLPSTFATNVGMMVSPAALEDPSVDLANDPGTAGSGPYIVTEYVPTESMTVTKAPSYWDPEVGRLGGIEIERVPDGSTRVRGVQTGATDLTVVSAANDLLQARQMADRGEANVIELPFRNILGVYLRADQGDLTKPEVRQAIAHAIDPEAISGLFSGSCTPYRQLHPASDWSAIPNYEYPYEYDPQKAASLVDSVGGAKVSVTFAAETNTEAPANVVLDALTQAGFDAELNPVPNSENEPRFIAGDFELMVSSSWSPKIDPADTVNTFLLDTYRLAPDPEEIRELAAQAADPTLSTEERTPIYHQIWETALEEVWFIPVCQQTVALLYNDKVLNADNVPWANIGIWDLRYIAMTR